jgi:hypothetical protein
MTHPEPTRLPASTPARTTRSLYLLALLTLAGAACDHEPTRPPEIQLTTVCVPSRDGVSVRSFAE